MMNNIVNIINGAKIVIAIIFMTYLLCDGVEMI